MARIAKTRTTDGALQLTEITGIIAHFTTMAATDTIEIRKKDATGTIIAKLQPAANNQSVNVQFTHPVKVNDEDETVRTWVEFTGTAAGTVTVIGS